MTSFKCIGQATVELMLSIGILLSIYLSVHQFLMPAVNNNINELTKARQIIWSRVTDVEQAKLSGEYRLNEHTKELFIPLNRLLPVELGGDNLRELKKLNKKPFYPMSRLTDGWQARKSSELSTRPASLVVNSLISGEVTELIQDGLGSLFLAEELRSDSLVFGTISPDVVPEEALQHKE